MAPVPQVPTARLQSPVNQTATSRALVPAASQSPSGEKATALQAPCRRCWLTQEDGLDGISFPFRMRGREEDACRSWASDQICTLSSEPQSASDWPLAEKARVWRVMPPGALKVALGAGPATGATMDRM